MKLRRSILCALTLCLYLAGLHRGVAGPGAVEALDAAVVGSSVLGTAVQADGKVILVGNFTSVLGVPRGHVARLNADGTLDASFNPQANAPVECVAVQADGKVLLGGHFTALAPAGPGSTVARGRLARLHADGTLDGSFSPAVDDTVLALAVQPDGKIVVGGRFTMIQDSELDPPFERSYLTRLYDSGVVDYIFNPRPDDAVHAVLVQGDGRIVIGGAFTALRPLFEGFFFCRGVARIDAEGVPERSFVLYPNGAVSGLAWQPDGKVLVGGSFTAVRPGNTGVPIARSGLLRVNTDGSLDADFPTQAAGTVRAIAVQADGRVLIAGDFPTVQAGGGPVLVNGVARVWGNGTLDGTFLPKPNGTVLALALQADGQVLLGGTFTALQPAGAAVATARNLFARLDNDAGSQTITTPTATAVNWTWRGAGPAVTGPVTVEVSTDAGASFTLLGTAAPLGYADTWQLTGATRPAGPGRLRVTARLAASSQNGSGATLQVVEDFGAAGTVGTVFAGAAPALGAVSGQPAPIVRAVAVQPDGRIVAGGRFTVAGGARSHLVRVQPDGRVDASFQASTDLEVYSLAVQADGKIVIGGSFTMVNGVARERLARLHADGSLDQTFTAPCDGIVHGLAVQRDGKIVVVGDFLNVAGTARSRVARLLADGTLEGTATFNPGTGANNPIYAVALQPDGKILVGGGFTAFDGSTSRSVVRLNADGTLESPTTYGRTSGPTGAVLALAVQPDGKIVVGGSFGLVGSTGRMRLARLQTNGVNDPTFTPGAGANATVRSLAVQGDGKIVVGGSFTVMDTTAVTGVVRVTSTGAVDPGLPAASVSTDGVVHAVALQGDGKIVLGGAFTTVGSTAGTGLARVLNDAATITLVASDATRVRTSFEAGAPAASLVTFERSTDGGATWTLLGSGTRQGGTTTAWECLGLTLPPSGLLRMRGWVGVGTAGMGMIEKVAAFAQPVIGLGSGSRLSTVTMPLTFGLPGQAGSVFMVMASTTSGVTATLTLHNSFTAVGTSTLTFDPRAPLASGQVVAVAGGPTIPDGTYTVTLRGANPDGLLTTSAPITLQIDTVTATPTLSQPASGAVVKTVPVQFVLPEAAEWGSAELRFTRPVSGELVASLVLAQPTVGTRTFTFDPRAPLTSAAIATANGELVDGIYDVTLRYRDALGNTAATAQVANVTIDTTPPVLTVPAPLTVEATSAAGAAVTFSCSAADGRDPAPQVTTNRASGSVFPPGTTTVQVQATDAAGNVATESFTVTVRDTTPPVLTLPANQTLEATSPAGAVATFAPTAADAVDPAPLLTTTRASGGTFPLGITTVQVTATDATGNGATGSFTVTVLDTTPPVLTVPGDLTVEANSASGAVVNFATAAVDVADLAPQVTSVPVSGSTFPLGTTTVVVTAKDFSGNETARNFAVTVRDTIAPTLTVPADQVVEATSAAGAVVSFAPSATDAVDAAPQLTAVPASGSVFAIGTTTVQVAVEDAAGNRRTGNFNVTVRDTTAPTLTLPAAQTVEATSPGGAVVSFTVPSADAVDAAATVTAVPPSGSLFPRGTTTVQVTAVDTAGNERTGSFTVTVRDTTAPLVNVPPLIELVAGPTGTVPIGDLSGYVTRSDAASASLALEQTPIPSTVLALGRRAVTFKVTDAAGNFTTVETIARVAFARPEDTEITGGAESGPVVKKVATGEAIPAGTALPAGATFGAFFAPALSDTRQMVARATVLSGKARLGAIYVEDGTGGGALPAYQGGPARDEAGTPLARVTFRSFCDPVTAPGGAIAFVARLQGAVAKGGDEGVWSDVFSPGEVRRVLAEGGAVPGLSAAKVKTISSVSLRDGQLLATLTLLPAAGVVTPKDDAVLVLLTAPGTGRVLLREGQPLAGETRAVIASFSVLQPGLGSPGQGRWHSDTGVLAKVALASGEVRIVALAADGAVTPLLSTVDVPGAITASVGMTTRWKNLGLPAQGGGHFALAALLQPSGTEVTAANDTAILVGARGARMAMVARKGATAPIPAPNAGPLFASFFDPVVNDAGTCAFLATLQGPGVTPANRTALFAGSAAEDLQLVARLASPAPDEAGAATAAVWSKFTNLALPGGESGGLVFVAETSGGDTTPKNKVALWGVDSQGQLRRLLRTGAPLAEGGPALTAITLLTAPPGAYGAARSYNETGSLAVVATFADKTQALLRLDLP